MRMLPYFINHWPCHIDQLRGHCLCVRACVCLCACVCVVFDGRGQSGSHSAAWDVVNIVHALFPRLTAHMRCVNCMESVLLLFLNHTTESMFFVILHILWNNFVCISWFVFFPFFNVLRMNRTVQTLVPAALWKTLIYFHFTHEHIWKLTNNQAKL